MGAPAADDENFCLRWNDYEKKYAETFRTLREDVHFADVTLACEGHTVKAHRIILCACSSYFQNILKSIDSAKHPVLLLSDVRLGDMTALMDFIYFGQVNITQDSLQSFLKVADKLKIKGLCERGTLIPEGPPFHNTITIPMKDDKKNNNGSILPHTNFDTLLPRSPYLTEQPSSMSSQILSPIRHNAIISSAPPAHQSPKNTQARGTTRPGEPQYMLISSPKKTKYSLGTGATTTGHPSILRNQLINKDLAGSSVEVKSEPLLMNSSHTQEEVPSSVASVSVTEFITTEGDLTLPPLSHGMSSQFMFTSDPASDPGAVAPAPATHVTIQPEKDTITSVSGSGYSATRVVSLSLGNNPTNQIDQNQSQGRLEDPEPKDLTPIQQVGNHSVGQGVISGLSSSPETPGKKDRNSRKQCPYCNKDFHEMSLKRHIKDVHFRSQDTSVICPQCCKQYASQNSLYSHLNRVHGVKKDDLQMLTSTVHGGAGGDPGNMLVRSGNQHNESTPEGIMDLAQHSDHSN